jgi:hypothetical protein
VRRKFPQLTREEEKTEKVKEYENLIWGARDRSLVRRVHHRCAEKVHAMVPELIQEFGRTSSRTRTAWRARSCELLKDVQIQSQKKMLMHVIGLLGNLICIAGLIAMLCGCPYVIPLALLIIGGVICTARYGFSLGMIHTYGWSFDAGNLIPDRIKAVYQKIFARCIHAQP